MLPVLIAQGRLVEREIWLSPLLDLLVSALSGPGCGEDREELTFDSSILRERWTSLHSKGIVVPEGLLKALEASFESPATDEGAAQAAWCWGLALGRRASDAAGEKELRGLLNKASRNFVMQEAFLERTAWLLHEKNLPLLAAMDESVRHLVASPGDFVLGKWGESFTKMLEAWSGKPSFEAFDLRSLEYVPFLYDFLGLINRLRPIDRLEYLSWLNRLKNPLVIRDALHCREVVEDFDEILMLLEAAPSAYGPPESEGWISPVAPMLLQASLRHAANLLAPFNRVPRDEAAYTELCADIAERMESLARNLARRSDGPRLAANWLMHLVRIKTQLHAWIALPASMAMKAIIQTFGDAEANAAIVIPWLPHRPPLTPDELDELRDSGRGRTPASLTPGMDLLVARLSMKAYRPDAESFEDELRIFENLLLLRDAGLFDANLNDFPTWRHQLVSCVFSGADPVATWKRLWNQMEEQRLRSRYIAFTNDHSADDASLFLSAATISLLGRSEGDQEAALWNEVYVAVWFMTLFYGSQAEGRKWRCAFVLLMGLLPQHFDLTTDSGIDKLAAILASFADDEELIIYTAAQLFRADAAPQLITSAASRAQLDFESALARFEQHAGNEEKYPLAKIWKDQSATCRQILVSGAG
jgi:hypothetical protein